MKFEQKDCILYQPYGECRLPGVVQQVTFKVKNRKVVIIFRFRILLFFIQITGVTEHLQNKIKIHTQKM